jgi:hypothetical protein
MARVELFIWWVGSKDRERIGPHADPSLPDYVREQYALCLHHRGGGSLWVDKRFGPQEIPEWPDTSISRCIQDANSAGIVFSKKDLYLFKDAAAPGVVTDFKLRMMVVT